jgi:hypothetical protein
MKKTIVCFAAVSILGLIACADKAHQLVANAGAAETGDDDATVNATNGTTARIGSISASDPEVRRLVKQVADDFAKETGTRPWAIDNTSDSELIGVTCKKAAAGQGNFVSLNCKAHLSSDASDTTFGAKVSANVSRENGKFVAKNISISNFVVVGGEAPPLEGNFFALNDEAKVLAYARSILKEELAGATAEDDQMAVSDDIKNDCSEVDDLPRQAANTVRKCFTWLGDDRYEGQTVVEFTTAQGDPTTAAGVRFALSGGNF